MALDLLELDRSIQIAKEAALGGADWIEAGTPLIKSEGMDAVREMKIPLGGGGITAYFGKLSGPDLAPWHQSLFGHHISALQNL